MRTGLALFLALTLPTLASAQNGRLQRIADAIVEATVPATDDPDVLATQLLTAARGAARSSASALAFPMVDRVAARLAAPDEALRLLDEYLAAEPHGLGAHAARRSKSRILRRLGRLDAARAIGTNDSYAGHFVVVGPFGDSGDDYLGVPFAPEFAFPEPDRAMPGRFGPVRSRVVRRQTHRTTIRMRREKDRNHDGCYYALNQVRTDAATAGYLEITTGGSFELFVNGTPTARVFRAEDRTPNRRAVPIRLAAGNNAILVKTVENGEDTLALRYLDAAGHPLAVTELTSHAPLPVTTEAPDVPELGPLVDGCRVLADTARAAAPEQRTLFSLAALFACLNGSHIDTALEILHGFDDEVLESARFRLALAVAVERSTTLPRELRSARVRSLVESVRDALPDHHTARLRAARLLADEDRREDAVKLLQERVASHPGEAATYATLYSLLRGLRFEAEARSICETWARRVPHDERPTLTLARILSRGGAQREALKLVNAALERHPGSTTLQRRALDLAIELDDTAMRDRMLAALYADDPSGLPAQRSRAQSLHRSSDFEAGLELDRQLVEHPDADTRTIIDAAVRLERSGDSDAAVAAYRRALEADPSRHADRRTARRLTSEGHAPEFPWIARFRRDADALIRAFEPTERERGSSSSLLLDQMIVRFYPDGSHVVETHEVRRLNDLRGVEAYEEAGGAANADEVLRVRTVTASGESFVPNRVRGSFQMPRIEPGAIIEQHYRDFRGAAGENPWRGASFMFQSAWEPYLLSELVVILPPDHPGTFRLRRFDGTREQVTLSDGYVAHVFRCEDVPRLETESMTPPVDELVPMVAYGEDTDFAASARAAYRSAVERARTSPWVAEQTRSICDGIEGDLARAKALHAWVHENIPQSRGPANPTSIVLRKQGPRFFLLVAMLQEAGVPFRHVVAKPTIEGVSDEALPLFDGGDEFPAPGVLAEPRGGEPFWMFVDDARFQTMGMIFPERLGAAALILGPGTHRLTRLPGGQRAPDLGWRFRGTLRVTESGGADFEIEIRKLGDTGLSLADQGRDWPKAQSSVIARQIASQVVPGWTVTGADIGDLTPGQHFSAKAQLQRRTAIQSAGDSTFLPLPLTPLDFVKNFADKAERTLPMRLTILDADDQEIVIDPGEHFEITTVPDGVSYRSEQIDYALTFTRVGRKVKITRRTEQRPGRIDPQDYDGWRRMLRRIDLAEKTRIGLRRRAR